MSQWLSTHGQGLLYAIGWLAALVGIAHVIVRLAFNLHKDED